MDPDSKFTVTVTDGHGRSVADGGLARWLRGIAPASATGAVGIALVTDARMRILNRSYRSKDEATDVLSFPVDARGELGDIVIARGVAARQAREHGHALDVELRVLALHGLLHLIGYDHDDAEDAGRMRRTEERLRRKGGLPTGLIGRADGPVRLAAPARRAR
ncbi:MAG: rRNA maturation RNase YbeY [Acidobacteriota bacterium]|nr:rRNA maturation RNase YbeY [Acidobacteriota bacterium]